MTKQSDLLIRFKVGVFTFIALILMFGLTVIVNDRPYWWRSCQLVQIKVEDATGLKTKSPIRSLGIEIGYLKSVSLSETHVSLGICLTAPVEVLSTTRAYIRGEGFLGDKFVELKPVRYLGLKSFWKSMFQSFSIMPSAMAAVAGSDSESKSADGKQIPVGHESQDIQHLMSRVDDLVQQVTGIADNLKQAINPEDLKKTMKQLNQTLENAANTLAPEGGLNQIAQRVLGKLEDAIEQLRDLMVRVNRGEGSVGMLLNDPTYAEELKLAIRNINALLNRVQNVRFVVDFGAVQVTSYNGGRAWFSLGIWPNRERYYLLGVSADPRGRIINTTVITTAGGQTQTVQNQTIEQTSLLLTGMLGKVFFRRLDLSAGALFGDGAVSVTLRLGPKGFEERVILRNDLYVRNSASSLNDRVTLSAMPIQNLYLRAGVESFQSFNGQIPFFFGGGLSFDDEDIKLLFAFK